MIRFEEGTTVISANLITHSMKLPRPLLPCGLKRMYTWSRSHKEVTLDCTKNATFSNVYHLSYIQKKNYVSNHIYAKSFYIHLTLQQSGQFKLSVLKKGSYKHIEHSVARKINERQWQCKNLSMQQTILYVLISAPCRRTYCSLCNPF